MLKTYFADSTGDGKPGDEEDTDGKSVPALTVLLHGSLKVLGMVAIIQVT